MSFLPSFQVFLENGQTKSFKYDSSTTVQDVIDSLVAKLGIRDSAHFSLVVEHIKSLRRNKLTILDPRERLAVVSCIFGPVDLTLWYIGVTMRSGKSCSYRTLIII